MRLLFVYWLLFRFGKAIGWILMTGIIRVIALIWRVVGRG